ncbi:MAG TPA: lipid-binding SYLF domain-containing protein [Bryobacteraceae bacterium]|nr:lipid-binding SYLF domain-containing protein [Bryobacteraceae bacterium]
MKGLCVTASFILASTLIAAESPQERLQKSSDVITDVTTTAAPDKGIPHDLFDKAQCVVIVPDLVKGAFVVGGEYGRGFAACRNPDGKGWGAPAAVRIEGGSVGFQIGGSATDLILLVMNQRGMDKLLGDKFTLGADASVAAGPVGRSANAETDVKMSAEILAWSRSRGLFAGISLKGATLRPDTKENETLYGRAMTNREVLMGNVKPTPAAQPLIAALDRYSSHRNEGGAERSAH